MILRLKEAVVLQLKNDETSRSIKLRGTVERVTYSNPENGFAILRVKPKRGGRFTVKGYIPEIVNQASVVGAEIEFEGSWQMSKYGRQFDFGKYKILGSELLFFLSKIVKGLGERLAKQLIETYGEKELVEILDNRPEELLKVKGIKEKRLATILKSWQKHRSLKELAAYLGKSSGITPNLLIRIYNYFGDSSLSIIKENPYRLTEVRGIGFKTADKIALGLAVEFDSPYRVRAAINHVLLEAAEQDGHCYLLKDVLISSLKELLNSEEKEIQDSRIEGVLKKMLLEGELSLGPNNEIGLSAYKYMEDWLKEFFIKRVQETRRKTLKRDQVLNFIKNYEDRFGVEFSKEQQEVILRIATEPLLVFGLAGYAGTGKTTVCRAILDLITSYYASKEDVICCAFTGMASSRLRKTTGYDALTIHSLLKYKGENTFEHGPENPLPHKVVLLDEASMVNLSLFYRLAKALRPSTLFILVGDPAQLPPIGAGNVFSDLLETGLLPSVHLKKIFRQREDSRLTIFANEIRQGKVPEGIDQKGWIDFSYERVEKHNIFALKKMDKRESELKRYREENNEAIKEKILNLARYYKKKLSHPIWEFQVLTPMRIGQLGTEILNFGLQKILNDNYSTGTVVKRGGIELKEGDKVVHLQNKDMEIMSWSDFIKKGKVFNAKGFQRVFNGNVGLVVKIDNDLEQFYVVYPERIVVAYDFDYLGDIIELAYALTVHKAQGSQYRIVVIPLSNSHYIMLNNKWFYTAITRAEEKVYIVGQDFALKRACKNIEGVKRLTWLRLFSSPFLT